MDILSPVLASIISGENVSGGIPNFVWLTPWCSAVNKYIILLLEEAAAVVVKVELFVAGEVVVVWAWADVIIIAGKPPIVIIIIASVIIANATLADIEEEHQTVL